MQLLKTLTNLFSQATAMAFPDLVEPPIEVAPSSQPQFGDYQFNSAMKLTKVLKQPPRMIAEAIVKHLPENSWIDKTEIAGPGFINIHLSLDALTAGVNRMLKSPRLDVALAENREKIVIDFSSPNTAKEMHVGHLRSTIIGDCLSRLFEFLGADVLRLNHIGDWGTAFGMLIAHLKETEPGILTGEEKTDLSHLVKWYRASKERFDTDPAFKKRSQLEVVSLQQGEPAARKAWEVLCQISSVAYQEIYDLLDVHLIERGESFYNPLLAGVVKEMEKRGLVRVSDGARCIFSEKFQNREGDPLPLIIQKSDGGYTYATTDLAAIRHRIQEEKADRIIYITDSGQHTHFQMIFKAAERAGILDPAKVKVDHVGFGLVLGTDGKKLRTRSGDTERLIDLLKEAVGAARTILVEKNPSMEPEELETTAIALGIGAVKYADLTSHPASNYVFSYEKMLRFEGNTAAFLLYAFVRVAGIKRKVGLEVEPLIEKENIVLEHPAERVLGVHLLQFHETLATLADDLLPHRLTQYLYELAEKFNAFFRDCRVEGTLEQTSRLLLCELIARTLKQGLEILGIHTVNRM